ncbi:MAG: cation-translocating P-type ATPase [Actinomycetaceae bacterium]|nr:cation-translocating P-type ATPase [Actinomycetaceae bacterium]
MSADAVTTDIPSPHTLRSLWKRIDRWDLLRTLVVALIAIAVALGATWPSSQLPILAIVGLVTGCWPIATEAYADALKRKMSMELSMLIAIIAAAFIGEWVTALVIITFVLAAEILEDLSMDRGRDALTELLAFLPHTVHIRRNNEATTIPLSEVAEKDIVIVSPGGRIPVDGIVVSGNSTVDQSRITGEPLPIDIHAGSEVFAGSINHVGAVEIQATRVGTESSFGRIITAVQQAQSSEAPAQRLADRLAAWLVYFALVGAALTYIVTRDLPATISVVVVAGACGIAAGTPLAVLAAIARIARRGAFVKDGSHLEALSTVDTVIFDKTGTLTTGTPTVSHINAHPPFSDKELLSSVAAAESYSEHPLGRAIVEHARSLQVPIGEAEDFVYQPGLGVSAKVNGSSISAGNQTLIPDAPVFANTATHTSSVHVSINGQYAGTIFLADSIRDSAKEAIADLHRRGLRTLMITGDHESAALQVAKELGIDNVRAGLLPDEKLAAIDSERAQGRSIVMVGDGVNDAPALARANVGIAMGSGTEIARESADIILISSDLSDLVQTIHTAQRARKIVMVNFIGTIAIDLIGMALAACGLLSPILAAFIHVGSETAFILNSARLIPTRNRQS